MVVVFVRSTRNCQAVVFVLNVTPEQVVQRSQWINFEVGKRIAFVWTTSVLKAHADSVHGLHQHSFFVPVRPDQFKHTGTTEPMRKSSIAERRLSIGPCPQRCDDALEVRKSARLTKIVFHKAAF